MEMCIQFCVIGKTFFCKPFPSFTCPLGVWSLNHLHIFHLRTVKILCDSNENINISNGFLRPFRNHAHWTVLCWGSFMVAMCRLGSV